MTIATWQNSSRSASDAKYQLLVDCRPQHVLHYETALQLACELAVQGQCRVISTKELAPKNGEQCHSVVLQLLVL